MEEVTSLVSQGLISNDKFRVEQSRNIFFCQNIRATPISLLSDHAVLAGEGARRLVMSVGALTVLVTVSEWPR